MMTKLIDEDGTAYTETKDVLNCQQRFYKNYMMRITILMIGLLKSQFEKIQESCQI